MRAANTLSIVRIGLPAGLFAGGCFLATQAVLAAWQGRPPGQIFELFASLLLGDATPVGTPGPGAGSFFLGIGLHFALSAAFGLLYGALIARLRRPARDRFVIQLPTGIVFGALLWVVNLELVGRFFFPQLASLGSGPQLLAHAFAFGLPLGWFLCLKLRDAEVPGVHAFRHRLQDAAGEILP